MSTDKLAFGEEFRIGYHMFLSVIAREEEAHYGRLQHHLP